MFDNKRKEEDKKCFVKHSRWRPTIMVLNESTSTLRHNFKRKVNIKTQSIGTEFNPDMRTLGLVAVAPLRHFGVNTEIDVDDRINMSGFDNISPELRAIPKLPSLRCEV